MSAHDETKRAGEERKLLVDRVRAAARSGHGEALGAVLSEVAPADLAEMLDLFDEDARTAIINSLSSAVAGEVLHEVSDESLRELAQSSLAAITGAVETMEPDEVADMLEALPDQTIESVLESLPEREAQKAEQLLAYGPDTAGGIMTLEFVLLAGNITAQEAVSVIQRSRERETSAHLFVSDTDGRLVGYLPLHRLVFARSERKVNELMETDPVTVRADTDQEEVVRLATKYDLEVVPVVDAQGKLLGVITSDDILEAAQEEGNEDMYRFAGTAEVDPVHTPVYRSTLLRLPWLMLSLVDGLAIAFMASHFESALKVVQIAFFIPLIPLMGGNVAVQSSTILVRSLALGHLRRLNLRRFLARQAKVAFLLSVSCGCVAALLPVLVVGVDVRMMIVVGSSVALAINVAGALGMSLPFLFNSLGIDPAISAGPFVTMINDVLCITIYLVLAMALY